MKNSPNSHHHIYPLHLLQHLHPWALSSCYCKGAKVPKATFQLQSSPCYELSKILTYPTPSSFLSLGPSHQHTCYSSSSAPALLIHTKGLQNHLTYYFIPIPLPFKAHSNQVFYPTTLAWLPMTSMLLTPTVNSLCSLLGTIYHSL